MARTDGRRARRAAALVAVPLLLTGCATDGPADDPTTAADAGSGTPLDDAPSATDADDGAGLAALLLVEGDADGLWGLEKDDADIGAVTTQSPVDLYPVEPLFTACAPPAPVQVPVLDASVRNHELDVDGATVGQAYQTITTGDPDDVDAMYEALAAAATSCVDGPPDGPPVTVTTVAVGDVGEAVTAVRSSEEGAWFVVVDAGDHAVVLAGFGDLETPAPVVLTDEQLATITRAAVEALP